MTTPAISPTTDGQLLLCPPSRSTSASSASGSSFTVRSLVFSKDGGLLAAAVGDCTAKVLQARSFAIELFCLVWCC